MIKAHILSNPYVISSAIGHSDTTDEREVEHEKKGYDTMQLHPLPYLVVDEEENE